MLATITEFQTVPNPQRLTPSDNYLFRLRKGAQVLDTQTVVGGVPVTFSVNEPGVYQAGVTRLTDSGLNMHTEVLSNPLDIPSPPFDIPKTLTLSL